jgi:hypothetical protein
MMVFFEGILMSTLPPGYARPGEQLVRACSIGIDKQFGFIEFSTIELTAAALGLDGIAFNHRSDLPPVSLKLKRPNDFRPDLIQGLLGPVPQVQLHLLPDNLTSSMPARGGGGVAGGGYGGNNGGSISTSISRTVLDGPNKIFVGGLPRSMTDEQVLALLQPFGDVKGFNLVKDPTGMYVNKGFAFCEFSNPAVTEGVVQQLNGLAVLDKVLLQPAPKAFLRSPRPTKERTTHLKRNDIRMPQVRDKLHFLGHFAPLLRRELNHGNMKPLYNHKQPVLLSLDKANRSKCTPAQRSLVFIGIHRTARMRRDGKPGRAAASRRVHACLLDRQQSLSRSPHKCTRDNEHGEMD